MSTDLRRTGGGACGRLASILINFMLVVSLDGGLMVIVHTVFFPR